MGSNPCRRLSLLGFAHPVVGSPFQVQVQCRQMTRIWDESQTCLCFALFYFCLVLYSSITKTCKFFWYQRDCYHNLYIFLYIVNEICRNGS